MIIDRKSRNTYSVFRNLIA